MEQRHISLSERHETLMHAADKYREYSRNADNPVWKRILISKANEIERHALDIIIQNNPLN